MEARECWGNGAGSSEFNDKRKGGRGGSLAGWGNENGRSVIEGGEDKYRRKGKDILGE